MIPFLALLAIAEEPTILTIRIEGDGAATPCKAVIGGNAVDPQDDKAVEAAFAPFPPERSLVELSGSETVAYRCIGGVIYRIQAAGYQFTKMAFVSQPPAAKD